MTAEIGFRLEFCEVIGGPFKRDGRWYLTLKCDCGKIWDAAKHTVRVGIIRSCGCKRGSHTKHGHCVGGKISREYTCYQNMLNRCYDPENNHFYLYGDRGISVCEQWRNSFAQFAADMGPCPRGMSIDRVDGNGNYEPSNCRWATATEQSRNRSNVVELDFGGEIVKGIRSACQRLGIYQNRVYRRTYRTGEAPAEAIIRIWEEMGRPELQREAA